jgi:tetratricopeptide (TPR) repeat protein
MYRTRLAVIGAASLMLVVPRSEAGKFSTWTGAKVQVSISVPDPPQAYLGKRTVRVEVQPFTAEIGSDHLRMLIEQALAPELGIDNVKPEAIIRVSLVTYSRPELKNYTLNEKIWTKTGEKTVYNKKGEASQQDVYGERVVPVQYWEGAAGLSLHVEAGATDGATLDVFDPRSNYGQKLKLSIAGEATPEAQQGIPSQTQILASLVQDSVSAIKARYTLTDRNEVVTLAIDDELKVGNSLAQAGKWSDALRAWDTAQMKKNPADRIYNLAAAYEVLAYDTYRQSREAAAASASFTKAMDMYAQAQQTDPGEKYIRQASARIARAKESMDRAIKQYQAQQFEVQKHQQELAQLQEEEAVIKAAATPSMTAGVKVLGSSDSESDSRFRLYVRTRLAMDPTEPEHNGIAELVAGGQQRYEVDPETGRRIVLQEIGKKRLHTQGTQVYREDLTAYAKDGVITKDERSLLRDIADRYGLGQEDTQVLESSLHFRELGTLNVEKPSAHAPSKTPATKRKPTTTKPK